MSKILGISGSLRAGSFNTALLRAAVPMLDNGDTLTVATLRGIPLYDGDLESQSGLPDSVIALKEQIAASDGVLLSTPEYNNGIPGVMKNAIDWLSRPGDDIPRVFGNRAFGLLGASPSGFGTLLAQTHWLPIFRMLGVRQWTGGRMLLSRAHTAFDASGELTDEAMQKQLNTFVRGFAAFSKS